MDPGMLARIRNYLDLRLEAFRRMIRQHVERELERRAYRAGERLTREVLTDKPLFALSPDEERLDEGGGRSEEHTSELQSPCNLVCRLLLEKKKKIHLRY